MNRKWYKHLATLALCLAASLGAQAQVEGLNPDYDAISKAMKDSMALKTKAADDDRQLFTQDPDKRHIYSVHTLARSYGDRIVLRWAVEEFAIWRMANTMGITIVRTDMKELSSDTLVTKLKPLSQQQMEERYESTDSLAGVAAQMMYGRGSSLNSKEGGSSASIFDVYDEQQTRYAYALLAAELRPDLAEAMAMSYTDRTAVAGRTYQYRIIPNIPDSVFRIAPGHVDLVHERYVMPKYEPEVTDSVSDGGIVTLKWINSLTSTIDNSVSNPTTPKPHNPQTQNYTAYDVERRPIDGEWEQVNSAPVINYTTTESELPYNTFTDPTVESDGDYEYRVRGIDSFGDKSEWSAPHKVTVISFHGQYPPTIKLFEMERYGKNGNDAFVTVHWHPNVPADSIKGYNVYYFHPKKYSEWARMNEELVAPTDSTYRIPVVALPGGYVTVSCIDHDDYENSAAPREIEVEDMTPPSAPTGLSHTLLPNGVVILCWNENPEDDIRGYQLYSANDTTHTWTPIGQIQEECMKSDTMAIVGVNQRYLYYRLRAIDYAGNRSEMSEILQVKRINFDMPERCVLDSMWVVGGDEVHMHWRTMAAHTIGEYRLYRRVQDSDDWRVVQTVNPDSVVNNLVHTYDAPPVNREKKYYYALEVVNMLGMAGEKSLQVVFRNRGPLLVDVPIVIECELTKQHTARLEWHFDGDAPLGYYYELEVADSDAPFQVMGTVPGDRTSYETSAYSRAKTCRFRVRMRWRDGRFTNPSEPVTAEFKNVPADDNDDVDNSDNIKNVDNSEIYR